MTMRVTSQVGLAELYKYRDKTDTILLFFGVVSIYQAFLAGRFLVSSENTNRILPIQVFAIITGAIFPILFIVFGDITDVLTQKEANPFMNDDIFMDGIIEVGQE